MQGKLIMKPSSRNVYVVPLEIKAMSLALDWDADPKSYRNPMSVSYRIPELDVFNWRCNAQSIGKNDLKVWSCDARDSTLVSTTFVLQHYCLSTLPTLLTFLTLTLSQTSTNTRHLLNIAYKAPIPPSNQTNFHLIASSTLHKPSLHVKPSLHATCLWPRPRPWYL